MLLDTCIGVDDPELNLDSDEDTGDGAGDTAGENVVVVVDV
jgi:hypothetical protein